MIRLRVTARPPYRVQAAAENYGGWNGDPGNYGGTVFFVVAWLWRRKKDEANDTTGLTQQPTGDGRIRRRRLEEEKCMERGVDGVRRRSNPLTMAVELKEEKRVERGVDSVMSWSNPMTTAVNSTTPTRWRRRSVRSNVSTLLGDGRIRRQWPSIP